MGYGATPQEWATFDMVLGLTDDLLPVVSDPTIKISALSSMLSTGKTPSIINRKGEAAGLAGWTSKVTTSADIQAWSAEPRYGICLQTRIVRALDIDVDGPQAAEIAAFIRSRISGIPTRSRENATKVLLLVTLPGDFTKRSFKTAHGLVEFLATGQQCIVAGTHTSGVRYQWDRQLSDIPAITADQFEQLWADLVEKFAIEAPTEATKTSKKATLTNAVTSDPIATYLNDNGYVISAEKDGRLNIRCPNEAEHTGPSSDTATVYYPANTGGYARGHFDCKHAHCQTLGDEDFCNLMGYVDDPFDDDSYVEHEAVSEEVSTTSKTFTWATGGVFSAGGTASWIIKGILPQAELGVLYGASSSGKSFKMLAMAMHVVHGWEWRGHRTTQGRVAYLAAEGASGFKNRVVAFSREFDTNIDHPNLIISKDPVNFLKKEDAKAFALSLVDYKPILVVIDTFARVTPGGNENSGEDMGRALAHCQLVHDLTGAMVVLIHHSGKDASRGARGWSGLRAAADWEAEVVRSSTSDLRALTVTKQKDGEDGQEFGFTLKTVEIGEDSEGDIITSCIVEDADAGSVVQEVRLKLGANEQIIVQEAKNAVSLDGLLPDVNTVIDNSVAQVPYDSASGKRDKRRENILRAFKKLIDKNVLGEEDGRVVVKLNS